MSQITAKVETIINNYRASGQIVPAVLFLERREFDTLVEELRLTPPVAFAEVNGIKVQPHPGIKPRFVGRLVSDHGA